MSEIAIFHQLCGYLQDVHAWYALSDEVVWSAFDNVVAALRP